MLRPPVCTAEVSPTPPAGENPWRATHSPVYMKAAPFAEHVLRARLFSRLPVYSVEGRLNVELGFRVSTEADLV